MNREEVLNLFQNITLWKRGNVRAPHKPLLILYALGKCARGEGQYISFIEIDNKLRKLLLEFGPSRKSIHSEYPFWRLQNDKIWELINTENIKLIKSSSDALKSDLIQHNVLGGFTEPIYKMLCRDKALLIDVATIILENHFPATIHEDILTEVGFDLL